MKEMMKNTGILLAITIVAGLLLGLVYQITKEPIAQQEESAKTEAYKAVFAEADSFEAIVDAEDADLSAYLEQNGFSQSINEIMEAKDASGEVLGYAINITTPEGYGGDITFSLGVKNDGTLNGIEILSIGETAGLGMNAGAQSEDEIDALSGATITSKAMVGGVNAGLCAFRYVEEGE